MGTKDQKCVTYDLNTRINPQFRSPHSLCHTVGKTEFVFEGTDSNSLKNWTFSLYVHYESSYLISTNHI